MAIPEACGLWIEQRVKEELEQKGETGASLREIGRRVASEVEKYFEASVNPGTIFQKARRIEADTNVSVDENSENSDSNVKSNEIKRAKDGTLRGGKRDGAGRKPSQEDTHNTTNTCEECGSVYPGSQCPNKCTSGDGRWLESRHGHNSIGMVMSVGFEEAYERFLKQVVNAKREGWERTPRQTVLRCVETINRYLKE